MSRAVEAAGDQVLSRAADDRAAWAEEHPGEFSHDLLRGLMRLAYSSLAAERWGHVCGPEECRRGLRLWRGFRPHELREAGRLLVDEASAIRPVAPVEGLSYIYQALLALRPQVGGRQLQLEASGPNRRWLGGSYFTPPEVVEGLLDLALEPLLENKAPEEVLDLRVCDPSCGGGAFLIAAARRIAERSRAPGSLLSRVHSTCIYGVDIDPAAVELCRFALWMEAPADVVPWRHLERTIRIGDALVGATPAMIAADRAPAGVSERTRCDGACMAAMRAGRDSAAAAPATCQELADSPFHWHMEFPEIFCIRRSPERQAKAGWRGGFDLVMGNPPFLNRLECATAAGPSSAAFLRVRFGGVVRCYADAATAFLLLGAQLLRPGGRVSLIQPQSLLAARDAGPARHELTRGCALEAIWFPTGRVFEASVRVCAPVLSRGPNRGVTLRRFGNGFAEHQPLDLDMDQLAVQETWSPLVADVLGIPRVRIRRAARPARAGEQVVGDLAVVTADFRDQYYGLTNAVHEQAEDADGHPQLVTTGLIDVAHCAWGERPVRFAGRRWRRPRVDLLCLEHELQRWAQSRLRPKILLATQTRVLEAAADAEGQWLPVTPLISILPRSSSSLWLLAAALCSPPVAAMAMERHAGVALSAGAIKLSARQVAALRLPRPGAAWTEAGERFRAASAAPDEGLRDSHLDDCAGLMCEAYELSRPDSRAVLEWWRRRIVRGRREPAALG